MLKIRKETLAELTSDDLASVNGGGDINADTCFVASCITNDIGRTTTTAIVEIKATEFC